MSGIAGMRSAGRRRKPIRDLEVANTFRKGRHGNLRDVSPTPREAIGVSPAPPMPGELIEGLGTRGTAVVTALWHGYDFVNAPAAQVLLRHLGINVDAVEDRTLARREHVRAMRMVLDICKHLNMERS